MHHKLTKLFDLRLLDHFELFVNVAIGLLHVINLGRDLRSFDVFERLLALDAFQKVAIFVHVKCQVVVCHGLDLLNGSQLAGDVNLELASQLCFGDFFAVTWIRLRVLLHVPEVALLVEVLV